MGAIFIMLGAIFAHTFSEFPQIVKEFVKVFRDLPGFQEILPGFSPNQNFLGMHLRPCNPASYISESCHYCKHTVGACSVECTIATSGMCAKNSTYVYVAWTSSNRVISLGDISWLVAYCQCEVVCACRSGFPFVTQPLNVAVYRLVMKSYATFADAWKTSPQGYVRFGAKSEGFTLSQQVLTNCLVSSVVKMEGATSPFDPMRVWQR